MYSELLKASASVKMTTGDAVTPSGKRPRLGAFNDKGLDEVGKGGPSQKKRKTAVAQPKKTKTKATGKRPSVVGDYSGEVEEEDDGDDESFGEGEQDVSVSFPSSFSLPSSDFPHVMVCCYCL